MKKSFVFVALAAVIAMCATSCKKDESVLKFTATIERGSSKTSLNGWADEARQVVWSEGDKIKVFGGELETYANLGYICNLTSGIGATTAEFEVDPDNPNFESLRASSSFTAVYPADGWMHSDEVYISSNQTYIPSNVFKYPMMAVSSSTHLQFKNVCGIIEVKLPYVENISLAGMKIKADHQISGNYLVDWNDGDPVLTPAGLGNAGGEYDGLTEIEVSFPQVIDLSAETRPSVLVYLPADDHAGINIEFYTTNFTYTKITAQANQEINVTRSKITTLDFSNVGDNIVWKPMPIHRNYFSVSDDLQVDFANGNLVYGDGGNWFIAQNHWDVYGNYNHFKDLFSFNNGLANTYGVYLAGTTNLNFEDWGYLVTPNVNSYTEYEAIDTRWRTLSVAEWEYLLNRETSDDKKFYVLVSLEDFYFQDYIRHEFKLGGLLLMPDDWYTYNNRPSITINTDDEGFQTATISHAELNSFLNMGCAFLPCAGSTIGDNDALDADWYFIIEGSYILQNNDMLTFVAGVDDGNFAADIDYGAVDWTSQAAQGMINHRNSVRLVRNAKHKVNGEWIYYTGFDPNQNTGAKKKRK